MTRLKLSSLSIRHRLPLLICLLLSAVIFIFGWISYYGVRNASLKIGQQRLQVLTDDLKTMLSGNTHTLITTTHAAAAKPAIREYLASGGKDSLTESVTILEGLGKDSLYINVALLDPSGKMLLNSSKTGRTITIPLDSTLRALSRSKLDSGWVGKLYKIDSSVYCPIISAVRDKGKDLGYIVRWRALKMPAKSLEQLTRLMGTDARLYLGNDDGSLWTDLQKPVANVQIRKEQPNIIIEYNNFNNKPVLSASRRIDNSHWMVAVELSKSQILQAAHLFLYWLTAGGIIILAFGVFLTWLMSRKITQPLAQLTNAASAVAAGNYSSVIPVNRYDEFGKLARSFNAMTVQVRNSQAELQKKADSYKLLFEKNPMPMWIISTQSLNILDVNEAAINHYGYSREEFLILNSKGLRANEDVSQFLDYMKKPTTEKKLGLWRHKKKDGSMIFVDIILDDIVYKDQEARLVLANDVTEKLKVEAELIQQRIAQQEIITETTIQAQEKEREELGKELHDNINQILASTKIYLELACNGDQQLLQHALSKSYGNINLAIEEIRQLSKQLVPPALDDMLVNVLGEMLEEMASAANIKWKLESTGLNEQELCGNIKLMIYRVVQEQVNNIIKHASAATISITIENSSHELSLIIEDDGKGFDTTLRPKGIGLRNIDSRVKFYRGEATIHSQEGKGCTLAIYIPLKNHSELLEAAIHNQQ